MSDSTLAALDKMADEGRYTACSFGPDDDLARPGGGLHALFSLQAAHAVQADAVAALVKFCLKQQATAVKAAGLQLVALLPAVADVGPEIALSCLQSASEPMVKEECSSDEHQAAFVRAALQLQAVMITWKVTNTGSDSDY